MIPLKDNVPTRHFPIVTVGLIVANVLVFFLYQSPDLDGSISAEDLREMVEHSYDLVVDGLPKRARPSG